MASGRSIVIEQRPSYEACTVRGRVVDIDVLAKTGGRSLGPDDAKFEVKTVMVTPPNTRAYNPAFDVTPAALIAGIVTEVGVAVKAAHGEYDLKSFVAANGLLV